jgi:DNA-binding transcriptional LysR family regulator
VELRQLTAFIAVAEECSFSRAGDRLHVAQSAVSATVRSLERELGTKLFERTSRRVSLTDAGRVLLPEARNVLTAAALAADSVAQVGEGLRGAVALGSMQAQGMHAISVAQVLAAFREHHPLVQVNVRHDGGSLTMAQQVRDGALDLAVISMSDAHSTGLRLTLLASEPMSLACTATHPLAGRGPINLVELTTEPFVDMPRGWGLRMAADRAFMLLGESRAVSFEVKDTASIIDFVREGLAIALLPQSMEVDAREITLVPIRGEPVVFQTFLAEPADRRSTAAARALSTAILALVEGRRRSSGPVSAAG